MRLGSRFTQVCTAFAPVKPAQSVSLCLVLKHVKRVFKDKQRGRLLSLCRFSMSKSCANLSESVPRCPSDEPCLQTK